MLHSYYKPHNKSSSELHSDTAVLSDRFGSPFNPQIHRLLIGAESPSICQISNFNKGFEADIVQGFTKL